MRECTFKYCKKVLLVFQNVLSLEISMEDISDCLHTIETALCSPKKTIPEYRGYIMRDIMLIRYGLAQFPSRG